jgi:hypothetical protein
MKINTFWNWFQDNNQTIKILINETPKTKTHCLLQQKLLRHIAGNDFMIAIQKSSGAGNLELS